MKPPVVRYLLLLLVSPLLAQAQVYKCKQADGSLHFQENPCSAGATGSAMAMPPETREPIGAGLPPSEPRRATPRAAKSLPEAAPDASRQRADEETRKRNEEIAAYNRNQRCNKARQQLGVLKEGGAVYRRDNAGDRHYVEDDRRPAEIAAAERRVAAECQ